MKAETIRLLPRILTANLEVSMGRQYAINCENNWYITTNCKKFIIRNFHFAWYILFEEVYDQIAKHHLKACDITCTATVSIRLLQESTLL